MNMVLKVFFSMSFSGAILILLLFLGERFLRDKISQQWQYYIWLIVILRLLFPFESRTNLMGKTYQAVDQAIMQGVSFSERQTSPDDSKSVLIPSVDFEQDNEDTNHLVEDLTAVHPFQDIVLQLINDIWMIWMAIALGMLIRKVTIYQGFIQYIHAGLIPVSDIGILDQLSSVAEKIGIKKPIELCMNPLISSPLLIGFFHPCIVLPSINISEKDFQYIVLHELIHYKRRDMFYKWLVQVTVCLHWFNPFVYLMEREITKMCEFSCDEVVLEKIGYENAKDYGKTLLDAMAAVGKYKEKLGAVTLSESKQLLKERLGVIMRFKKQSRVIKILTGILTFCVILGASFVGIYTRGDVYAASNLLNTAESFSLSLNISDAAVNMLTATENKISAEYNSDVYTVAINKQKNNWNISISCKTKTNTNAETIKLYIPDVNYSDVNLNVDSGHLICDRIRSGNIVGNFNRASVFLTLPEGFTGSVNATATNGYFQLVSKDNFKNTTTTIIDNSDGGEIYKPKNFKQNGNISTFTDGIGKNQIQVIQKGSGVIGIYTSNMLDTSDLEEFWQEGVPSAAPEKQIEKINVPFSEIEQYYETGNLALFQIAFSRLDKEAQRQWLDKIYAENQIMFWGIAVSLLDEDGSLIQEYAEKIYENDSIAYFSILAMHMSEDTLEKWLDRTQKDGKWSFQSMLFNVLDRDDEFNERKEKQEKEWEEAYIAKYREVGITIDGKNYYYQGELVHIFLDIVQSNQSFCRLDINPTGTANIKIVRGEDGKIIGVAYMSEKEVEELLGDMSESDDF